MALNFVIVTSDSKEMDFHVKVSKRIVEKNPVYSFFMNICFLLDVDECLLNIHDCSVNADCSNNLGSYSCKCRDGFSGDGKVCSKGWLIISLHLIGKLLLNA